MSKKTQHLFTKNGKKVTSYRDMDSIMSLVDFPEETDTQLEQVESIVETHVSAKTDKYTNVIRNLLENLRNEILTIKKRKVKLIPTMWAASSAFLIILVIILTTTRSVPSGSKNSKYSVFSSKPLVLSSTTARLFGGTTKSAALDAIFERYNCPLEGMGRVFVHEAEENGLPFWLTAAISFQESNCGRKTPKADGIDETYNAWGWGVWGDNLRVFDSWEEGIKKVSKYLGDDFFSQGITDTCEIMKVYTPPSDGSWCAGVNYFGEIIQEYQSPKR